MKKLYIAHISGVSPMSMMVKAITLLNHPLDKDLIFTHNAFIYCGKDGKKWKIETDIENGINIEEFVVKDGIVVKYTLLPTTLFSDCCFSLVRKILNFFCEEANCSKSYDLDFKEFVEKKFKPNSSYSLNKALQSLKIDFLPKLNIFNMFREKIEEEIGKNKESPNVKQAISDLFTVIADECRNLNDSITNENDDISKQLKVFLTKVEEALRKVAAGILHVMTDDYAKGILNMYLIERDNKDQDKKFWYCTEFVLNSLNAWCKETNVFYPEMLLEKNIVCQEPKDIYPHRLYLLLKENNVEILDSID